MPIEKRSLSEKLERIKNSTQQLPATATSLNSASDLLAKSVNDVDANLKRFSLGVPAWVTFASYGEDPYYHTEDIGYSKIGGRWGIALRTVKGDLRGDEDVEQWLFNDAPRHLRVEGADKLPDLLEELIKKAAEMAKSITEKAGDVSAVAEAMSTVLGGTAPKPKKGGTFQALANTKPAMPPEPPKPVVVQSVFMPVAPSRPTEGK